MINGQGKMQKTDFGALRESNKGRGRFDLLPYEAMEALAIWYEDGAAKYGERNWEKGLSVKDCINRMKFREPIFKVLEKYKEFKP